MKEILIWGTGIKAKLLCNYLNFNEVKIIGFTDNSCVVNKKLWDGYRYLHREKALGCRYDYIVIASAAYCEITASLIADGVVPEKIIQANNVQFMMPNTLYFFDQVECDSEKYKIFTDINLFSSELI